MYRKDGPTEIYGCDLTSCLFRINGMDREYEIVDRLRFSVDEYFSYVFLPPSKIASSVGLTAIASLIFNW